jgi:AcrR family transcriptional regulator
LKTKDKIIQASVELFNKYGISKVTLRDIAEKVGISIGNLAYHYKNKDYIIEEIFQLMENERAQKLAKVEQVPSFQNANEQALEIINLSIKYKFFYLDTIDILRDYPSLAESFRKYVKAHIKYVRVMLQHSENKKNIIPEPKLSHYDILAEMVWLVIQFNLQSETIKGNTTFNPIETRNAMWALILPYLTNKGRQIFLSEIV